MTCPEPDRSPAGQPSCLAKMMALQAWLSLNCTRLPFLIHRMTHRALRSESVCLASSAGAVFHS
ncbi:hypothetical protein ACFFLM_14305 [Deinococcus oregonensis]|uniref:Uncharacterized protein n=1 Tax=Deinococcus oregonensis TaxID=1805970 RepID=A0ABV6B3Y9_9DEIO